MKNIHTNIKRLTKQPFTPLWFYWIIFEDFLVSDRWVSKQTLHGFWRGHSGIWGVQGKHIISLLFLHRLVFIFSMALYGKPKKHLRFRESEGDKRCKKVDAYVHTWTHTHIWLYIQTRSPTQTRIYIIIYTSACEEAVTHTQTDNVPDRNWKNPRENSFS